MPQPFPIVTLDGNAPTYDSLDQAAHEISKNFAQQPQIEQSAALFKTPAGYQTSAVVTNSDHDNFGMRVQLPQGVTLAGIIHGHPGNDELAGYFSPNDINVANQLKVPSYIRFLSDNSLRRFTPGQTKINYMMGAKVARGDGIKLPESGAPAQKLASALLTSIPTAAPTATGKTSP